MPLESLQHEFTSALLQPEKDVSGFLGLLQSTHSLSVEKQLSIYRSNINGAHEKVLAQVYPACLNILGEMYFNQLCLLYRVTYPSKQPDLNQYGENFPRFIHEQQKKYTELLEFEYLPDLVNLEWHWHNSYFSENDDDFDFPKLMQVNENQYYRLVFCLSLSLSIHRTHYPIYEIWQANTHDADVHQIFSLPENDDHYCIFRSDYMPVIEKISATEYAIMDSILNNTTLDDLVSIYQDELQCHLNTFIQKKWITGFVFRD